MRVAIAVPSLEQGRFLAEVIDSLVVLGGSISESPSWTGLAGRLRRVIRWYEGRLTYWRSTPGRWQGAAINEGIAPLQGTDHDGWLNADDALCRAHFSAWVPTQTRTPSVSRSPHAGVPPTSPSADQHHLSDNEAAAACGKAAGARSSEVGDAAALFDPPDPAAAELVRRGRARVERFSLSRTADPTLDLFDQVRREGLVRAGTPPTAG